MENVHYNHKRDLKSFEQELDLIRSNGFNPIGVSQMMMEDTFIFETDEEAEKAFELLEKNRRGKGSGKKVVGWWYGKDSFLKEKEKYENEYSDTTVLVHWL